MTSTPPDTSVWWDTAATAAAVLDVLRLTDTDVDADRIAALVPAAGDIVNAYLDRVDPVPAPPPPPLQAALEQVTVELYRRKDAAAGTPGDFSILATVTRPGGIDPVAEVAAQLRPYKQRFGIG